jgi:putative inorganic carbon (HCO3(-)) transporter
MTFPLTLIFIWLVFWRPQEWLFPWMFGLPFLDAVIYMALLGLLMEGSQQTIKMPKTPALKLAIGLWFASIMSHVAHTYFQGILNTYQETFKISLLLVLLLIVINTVNRARAVVLMFILAAIVMSAHAILQAKTGVGFGGGRPLVWWHPVKYEWILQTQFFGIFNDPNDLGQILLTAIPLVFAFPRRLNPVAFMMAGGVVWLIATALLTTRSRGSLVGVVAMAACVVFMKLPTRWLPYVATLGLIVGLGMCALGGAGLLDESARERVVFWGDANRAFKASPLFGIGYGMFAEITEKGRAGHNAFVVCYTELGFFGYWFWFNLMTLGLIGCWRTRAAFQRPKTAVEAYLKRLAGLGIAAMAGFAASSYFLSRAYVYPFFFLFGLLNAIAVIAQRQLPEDHRPLLNFRKDVLMTGTLATAASIVYVYVSVLLLNRAYGG